jgi:pyroglutamyl-peptidase
MTTILLTGFEPFGGDAHNPTQDAVALVRERYSGEHTLVTGILPVTFAGAPAELARLIDEHDPDVVIATGLAGGRDKITVERIGVNLQDARIPDNAGFGPVDLECVPGGPAASFATLPVKSIVAAVQDAGIPCWPSLSAGAFVCNTTLYAALQHTPHRPTGFIHVPWATGQAPAGEPEMPLDDIVRALEIAVEVSAAG